MSRKAEAIGDVLKNSKNIACSILISQLSDYKNYKYFEDIYRYSHKYLIKERLEMNGANDDQDQMDGIETEKLTEILTILGGKLNKMKKQVKNLEEINANISNNKFYGKIYHLTIY